jgi:lipoprotein-releasing system ATP-binding protein
MIKKLFRPTLRNYVVTVSQPSVLEAHEVKKRYKQGSVVTEVLHGVSARFVANESYAITGVSGSGKSTFMHILAGLDHPDSGSVTFNGQNIFAMKRREKEHFLGFSLGLVFQNPYLIPELSVVENVMIKGLIAGQKKRASLEQAHELLTRVGLEAKAQAHCASLSGGQQQRVAIARALFNKPSFFLADEPTGNLDHETAKMIIDLLFECKNSWSMGLIISSHDPYVSKRMQHVLHMEDGVLTSV